ncbi:MAG: hypothetical protein Kow0065_20830 [Methylomicrobium sp.]
MIDSVSGLASMATQMSMQQTAIDTTVAVFNKVQDQQQAEGQAILQLIESTPVADGSIDVYV